MPSFKHYLMAGAAVLASSPALVLADCSEAYVDHQAVKVMKNWHASLVGQQGVIGFYEDKAFPFVITESGRLVYRSKNNLASLLQQSYPNFPWTRSYIQVTQVQDESPRHIGCTRLMVTASVYAPLTPPDNRIASVPVETVLVRTEDGVHYLIHEQEFSPARVSHAKTSQ